MATITRQAACEVLKKIREERGWISATDRANSPPAVLRALDSIRQQFGAATRAFATDLYSRDARFVYELIQNAEDNDYTKAEEDGINLFLSFSIYPDKIVLDSNEDGFLEEHVKAICSTGVSTKTATQGYIGEKGIGFKSVFKVGKKVHIQSGPFSFSFKHTRDSPEDGLGMVTPLDEAYDELPDGVRTRITLTFFDPSDFQNRVQDMSTLPDTLLLFLVKLKTLHINIYPEHDSVTEITYNHLSGHNADDNLETIIKTITINGELSETIHKTFRVVRKEIVNLPDDAARRNTNQATVVLAFPVDDELEPIIEQQHVFAFLPLCLAGFTFLIQSDFITQASRENISQSVRNEHLLSGVAETFRDAVLEFRVDPNLAHQWIRYLPSNSISDDFWKNLRPKIVSLLSETRCLLSWSESSLYLPRQLYCVAPEFKDRDGEPLFADLADEAYLSRHYPASEFDKLRALGVHRRSFSILVERIRSDLQSASSKMKAVDTDEDWHTRAALLFSRILTTADRRIVESLKSIDLIPLQSNIWVSATALPISLPDTEGISIPTDLRLNLVQSAAVLNAARKDFFMQFGVSTAHPSNVISLIIGRYDEPVHTISMGSNISHLRYLYRNLPEDTSALDMRIFFMNQRVEIVYQRFTSMRYMYFQEEEEEFGPYQLFQTAPSANPDAPGLPVDFLNMAYLNAVPADIVHHGRPWKDWLAHFADIQSYPQLLHPRYLEISYEFAYIIEHRPEKLIGLLKRFWSKYESDMTPAIERNIKNCCVP